MSDNDDLDQVLGDQSGLGDVAGAGGGVADEPGLVGAGAPGVVQEQGVPAGSGAPAQEVQMSGEDSDIEPADDEEGAAVEEANRPGVIDAYQFPMADFRLEFLGLVHSVLRRLYYHNHILMWPRDSPNGLRQPHGGRNRSRNQGSGDRGGSRSGWAQGQSRGAGAGEGPSWGALSQLEDAPIQGPAPRPREPTNQMHQAPEPEQPEDASHQASAPQLEAAQPGPSQIQWAAAQQEAAQYQPENSDEEAPKPGDEEETEAEGETEKEAEEETEQENEQEPQKSLDAAEGRPGNSRYL
ncbi:PREDICTED: cancer/testis antigen 47B-like [Chrysochloris asiatica]|uniref:Cancer/testis antigen 47B-like n=1 Tax=Chrysochloris asiatica TaxID=185453 RepID=A0A9B0WW18_CHRAS|nr:PREDICTED: cancer/testis antigen 47B-like [Chrysochloris asiatica]